MSFGSCLRGGGMEKSGRGSLRMCSTPSTSTTTVLSSLAIVAGAILTQKIDTLDRHREKIELWNGGLECLIHCSWSIAAAYELAPTSSQAPRSIYSQLPQPPATACAILPSLMC